VQHAWLGLDTGFWFLRTDCQTRGQGVVRTRVDKAAALSEPAGAGQMISLTSLTQVRTQRL